MEAHWLAHLANVLFGAAYLVRGILWLRILSIIACMIMAVFNYYAPAEPLWVAIYWNVFFSAVNIVQVCILFRERSGVSFSEEESELFDTVFRQMSPMEFMKILRIGRWETLDAGTTIIGRDEEVSEIRLVYNGKVLVEIDEDTKVEVKDGAFLGEMAFVSGSRATGKVSAMTTTRLLSWTFKDLHRLFHRNPEIKSCFQSIISSDLATKLTPAARR